MVFDNVNGLDKLRLSLTLPFRFVQELIIFNQIYVFPVVKYVKNWWDVGFVYMGISSDKKITLKDGNSLVLYKQNINELVSVMRSFQVSRRIKERFKVIRKGDIVEMTLYGRKVKIGKDAVPSFISEFSNEPHKGVNVRGRQVIDVGAYLGETAVYYALAGHASHVYAYEPFPFLCRRAAENVERSGLGSKITMLNAAVSGKNGKMKISDEESSFTSVGSSFGTKKAGKATIEIISLDKIVEKYRIKDGVIKIDVEGAEYDMILMASSRALNAFKTIHIEYHYGYLNLVKRLESEGFEVTRTSPVYNYKGLSARPMLNGDILAVRK